jgi:hypothetical protein
MAHCLQSEGGLGEVRIPNYMHIGQFKQKLISKEFINFS